MEQVVGITLTAHEVAYLNDCGFTPGRLADADVWPFPSETIMRKLWAALPVDADA